MRAVVGALVEGLEDPLQVAVGDARAAVDDADRDPVAERPRAHQRLLAGGEADRVLEQVGERPLELGGVGADEGQVAVERRPGPAPPRSPRSSTAAATTSSIEHQSGRG